MNLFIPDMYVMNIYEINYEKLKSMGIKCLLFDLDNTIAPYSKTEPDKKLKEFIHKLERNFKVIILSNSGKKRLKPFKEGLNVDVAFKSKKPFSKKYKKIMKMYHFKTNEMACIGDQLMTDILGGNKLDIYTILVERISKYERFPTKINRFFEKIIKWHYHKKGVLISGEYYE